MLSIPPIDSGPVYGRSVSRQLNNAVRHLMEVFAPEGDVIKEDPNTSRIPPVAGSYTPEEARTPGAEGSARAFWSSSR
jgi:FMN-dependent NADH-azoreductase